jgi:hypothetical protein
MNKTALKIFCLVVSMIIWIQVATTHTTTRNISIPLELTGLKPGLTLAGSEWPSVIPIKATGSKLDFFLNRYFGRNLGSASVDVSSLIPGTNVQRKVTYSDINSPLKEFIVAPPVWLDLVPDMLDSTEVHVEVKYSGLLDNGIMLLNEPVAEPEFVTLVGPSRFIGGELVVSTEPIDLARITNSELISRRLIVSKEQMVCKQEVVKILVEISKINKKVFNHIPIVALKDSNYGNVIVTPPVVDIVIEGPVELLQELAPDEISVLISLTGLDPGSHSLQAQVQLPESFKVVSLEPEIFNIVIGAGVVDGN